MSERLIGPDQQPRDCVIIRDGIPVLRQLSYDELGFLTGQDVAGYIQRLPEALLSLEQTRKILAVRNSNTWLRYEDQLTDSQLESIKKNRQQIETAGTTCRAIAEVLTYFYFVAANKHKLAGNGIAFDFFEYNYNAFYPPLLFFARDPQQTHISALRYGVSDQPKGWVTIISPKDGTMVEIRDNSALEIATIGKFPMLDGAVSSLYLLGWHQRDETDPVVRFIANPALPIAINSKEELERLMNIFIINAGKYPELPIPKIIYSKAFYRSNPHVTGRLVTGIPDPQKAEALRSQIPTPREILNYQPTEDELRQEQEEQRREEAEDYISKHEQRIPANLGTDARSLLKNIIRFQAWGERQNIETFIGSIRASRGDLTAAVVALNYACHRQPRFEPFIRKFIRVAPKEHFSLRDISPVTAELQIRLLEEYTTGKMGGTPDYPTHRIIEWAGERYAFQIGVDEVYLFQQDGTLGEKLSTTLIS